MNEIVLITGASGFLGSFLIKGFLGAGYKVFAYKRKTSNLWRLEDIVDRVTWFDINDLKKPFETAKINHVIHTATCYGRNNESPSEIININLLFPLKLFELAMIFNTDTFFNTDTMLYKYLNSYSLSKKQLCEWLKQLAKNTKVINIKLEHIYGPFDDNKKFISYIIEQCSKNAEELPLTLGEQKRDFIYVDDVVDAYKCVLKNHEQLTQKYNDIEVGSGETIKIRELVEFIAKVLHSKTKLMFGALPYREGEIMESAADISKLKDFSWRPKVDLASGIKKTIYHS